MEYTELIRARESVRDYDSDRPVPREVLERILEAGRIAPSAANRQPWKFIVAVSPEALARVRVCYSRDWFRQAPAVLAVAGRRTEAWTRRADGYNALETDLTIAMDHMILAAENEGVGSCWIAAFDRPALYAALGLAEGEEVFAITPLGYPNAGYAKKGVKDRRPLPEIARFI